MNDLIENTPFRKIAIITFQGVSKKLLYHYDLLYVMRGAIRIRTENGNFFLDEQDVILLDPHENYTVYSSNDNLVLSVIIDNSMFGLGKSVHIGKFVCNSSVDEHRHYNDLRRMLSQIASVYFNKKDINHLHLAALGYQLLYYLNLVHYEENLPFTTLSPDNKYSERMNLILTYIHQNYQEQISLQQLADYSHLSPSYLSKFFKKNMQTNFNQYLNHVRMQHALDDLMHTDNSIMVIAQDNGFPNISSFNKLFKEEYHTTPNRYRTELSGATSADFSDQSDVVEYRQPSDLLPILNLAQSEEEDFSLSDIHLPGIQSVTVQDDSGSHKIRPLWNSMLNLASADRVIYYNLEKVMYKALEDTSFRYGRIYHALSERFMPPNPNGGYEHFNLSIAVEMILTAKMCPYIELSNDVDFLRQSKPGSLENCTVSLEEYLAKVEDFLRYIITIFETREAERWIFEISWYCYYPNRAWENPKAYARRYRETCRLIKSYLPNALVGGIGFFTPVPTPLLEDLLKAMEEQQADIDFVSFAVFPYEYTHAWGAPGNPDPPKLFYSSDEHYALHKIQEYKNLLRHFAGYRDVSIHISALATSMHQSKVLNDSCFQASFLAQSTMDLLEKVDIIGYFQMADITFASSADTDRLLNGCNGLLNVFGIRKPGLVAISLFNDIGQNLLERGENYILTRGYQSNTYCLVVCNHIHPSDEFCMNPMQDPPLPETYSAFRPPRTLSFNFTLEFLKEGSYSIVGFHVNKEQGSLLDEWQKIDYWSRPDRNEIEYLKHIIYPKRTLLRRTAGENGLTIPFQLAPHEVAVFTIAKNL